MTAPDRAIARHVVIQCPACGACESAEAGALIGQPMIVCRECGETWPTNGAGAARETKKGRHRRKPGRALIDATKQPLVTYTEADGAAWAGKIAGDRWPEPVRQRRLPMFAAGVASVLFLAAFLGARQAAVAAIPDLAGLYAAVGLPVNLDGLAIENVGAERTLAFGGARVTVRATIRNIAGSEREIPPLVAEIRDGSTLTGAFRLEAPPKSVAPGQSTSVLFELPHAPAQGGEVALRFLRRGETLPPSGVVELTQK